MTDQGDQEPWRGADRREPMGATSVGGTMIESVYRREHERLWRSLYAFTGDREVASEAAAETVSQALRRESEIRDPAAWIWRSAFRVAAGLMAARSRHLELVVDNVPPGAAVVHDSSMVEFLDLLKTLSDQQRAIVVLRYAGGFTPTDIAPLLDTTPNAVRVQLHRAQAHLRERIDLR